MGERESDGVYLGGVGKRRQDDRCQSGLKSFLIGGQTALLCLRLSI